MNLKSVEKKPNSAVELTIELSKEEISAGLEKAFRQNASKIKVHGFRPGKAPRKIVVRAELVENGSAVLSI